MIYTKMIYLCLSLDKMEVILIWTCRSVCLSICRASVVSSITFDPYLASDGEWFSLVTWLKVKITLMVLSASFDIFVGYLLNLVQYPPLRVEDCFWFSSQKTVDVLSMSDLENELERIICYTYKATKDYLQISYHSFA